MKDEQKKQRFVERMNSEPEGSCPDSGLTLLVIFFLAVFGIALIIWLMVGELHLRAGGR